MLFTEKHHAYIITRFFRKLNTMGQTGKAVFRLAAQNYGEQRGRRMALRSLRDGYPLDFLSYFAYGEWTPTEGAFSIRMEAQEGIVEEEVFRCPWAEVFADEDALDCGVVYCREIDRAITRGFNPDLNLELIRNIHNGGSCLFRFRDKSITRELFERAEALPKAGTASISFDYHCGHLYSVFCDTAESVYGTVVAVPIINDVLAAFRERFGQEMANILRMSRDTNFLRIPDESISPSCR